MTDHEIAGIPIPDYSTAYAGVRERTSALLRAATPEQLAATAPATPEWTVKDILGHMVGVPTDVLAGRTDGIATDAWTGAQVERYRAVDLEAVIAEWDEASATVEPMIADFGVMAGQAILDVTTHEHDLRHALGVEGARDTDAVHIGSAWGAQWIGQRTAEGGHGTLRIETDLWSHTFGEGTPTTTLRTSAFELMRAATGRRSEAQIAAYEWDGPALTEVVVLAIFSPRPEDFQG
jgi:uncharacterized protein (TIGR03083 family)